jgi:hypothetical protein
MNANEMADKLSQYGEGAVFASIKLTDVANMLRHQADYIKHLEEGLESSINLNKAQAEKGKLES